MSFPRGKGRILSIDGTAFIAARCPICGAEHRYAKGETGGEEIAEVRRRGYSDEWLPCQHDLPGNFWRVIITGGRKAAKGTPRQDRAATSS